MATIQTSQLVQNLEDRYVVERILDQEGLGQVSLAMDTQQNQRVVIKVLQEPLIDSMEVRQQFRQAANLRMALGGEHITQVLDSGINAEGFPFYVMEYLQGESLRQCLQREQKLPIQKAINIACQICMALESAHQRRFESLLDCDQSFTLVPHDLKPSHIFLMASESGASVKLLDGGLTKSIHNYCRESQNESVQNVLPGAFHYAAPEQLELEDETGHLADIYVLGIILYEMLCGTDPFGLDLNSRLVGEVSWVHAHAFRSPRSLLSLQEKSQATVELSDIIHQCLAKKPSDRYNSVPALRQALEQVSVTVDDQEICDRSPSSTPDVSPDETIVQHPEAESHQSIDHSFTQVSLPSVSLDHCEPLGDWQEGPDLAMEETVVQAASLLAQPPTDQTVAQVIPPIDALEAPGTGGLDTAQAVEETVVQNANLLAQPPTDRTMAQVIPQIDAPEAPRTGGLDAAQAVEETVVQYSDSAIHNPADQTVAQTMPLDEQSADQTLCQQQAQPAALTVVSNEQVKGRAMMQNLGRGRRNFTALFVNASGRLFASIRRLFNSRSRRSVPQLPAASQPARNQISPSVKSDQPSLEQYQKSLRELNQCRLSFARELARNGKFRDAIATANSIPPTSSWHQKAQKLIKNWQGYR
jgi:eukaryotic-like serine/threonine-protein kinase